MTPNDFPLEEWFKKFAEDLRSPKASTSAWPHSPLAMLLEALADASAEQFANPLAAMHLRRFGAAWAKQAGHADRLFWVRGEWQKVDLSYGLATPFEGDDWNEGWYGHATGDLGQIETKVWYAHRPSPIGTVAHQLDDRRRRNDALKGERRRKVEQQLHALVILFQHRANDRLAAMEAAVRQEPRLRQVGEFVRVVELEDLGKLWPTRRGEGYRCSLSLGLFGLAP